MVECWHVYVIVALLSPNPFHSQKQTFGQNFRKQSFYQNVGDNIRSGHPVIQTIPGLTLMWCGVRCMDTPGCGGFNHGIGSRLECQLVSGLTRAWDIQPHPEFVFYHKDSADCQVIWEQGRRQDGVYTVTVAGQQLDMSCDMTTDGGGWTVLMRRQDGSVNFVNGWAEYKTGFGSPEGEHWIGNEVIHQMTTTGVSYTLRIDMRLFPEQGGSSGYATYSNFSLGSEEQKYTLNLANYTGGDVAGWWYKACSPHGQLTGTYGVNPPYVFFILWWTNSGIMWETWPASNVVHPQFVEMKIRPEYP